MPSSCIVPGCREMWKRNEPQRFYVLPADLVLRRSWLDAVSRPDLMSKFRLNYHVCSKHFVSGNKFLVVIFLV